MLGTREIRRRRLPFALITAIISLVSYLVMMVNGLGAGLKHVSGSAVLSMDADAIAYSEDSGLSVLFSEFDDETITRIVDLPGVEQAAAISYVPVNYKRADGERKPAAFFGYDPGTIGEPEVIDGRPLSYFEDDGALVDREFLDAAGLHVGDRITVTVKLTSRTFTIRGVVDEGYFFFQPVVYVLRDPVNELLHAAPPTTVPLVLQPILAGEIDPVADASSAKDIGMPPVRLPHAGEVDEVKEAEAIPSAPLPFRQKATIVLLKGDHLPGITGAGFRLVTPQVAFHHVEGVAIQEATVNALSSFGYFIGAVVVGVFFYVFTIQKVQQIGMLKAIGMTNSFIIGNMLFQVALLGAIGVGIASAFAVATAWFLARYPDAAPVLVDSRTIVLTGSFVLLTAVAGTFFSARHVMQIDPIIALGQQQ
ncbi:MAG: ABC transporter permease [Dehalococcoidia bacterium]|nr:ABC transporter permease [Dehalococcoidia bacterium]